MHSTYARTAQILAQHYIIIAVTTSAISVFNFPSQNSSLFFRQQLLLATQQKVKASSKKNVESMREREVDEFHETCHSVTFYFVKKDSKRCRDTSTPESVHTKDESKRGSAFAFIFGVN